MVSGVIFVEWDFAIQSLVPTLELQCLTKGFVAMKVIRAEAMGLCFGVRDALAAAAAVPCPANVTIHGELVHNERVLVQLQSRGFAMQPEQDRRIPTTDHVLITAHGISDRERQRLADAGKTLVDTTCPLVRRVHMAAQQLACDGHHIVVIGRPGHVEVRGIVEDLDSCRVIASVDDVECWPFRRLGIVCQSTTPPALAEAVVAEIRRQNPQSEVRFIDTICHPTRDRQEAVDRLCREVDTVVVVGGANSNNTRQLVALCEARGVRALHVQSASDLDPAWFTGCETVGLTAGTSTLDETIDEVERWLTSYSPAVERRNHAGRAIADVLR